MSFRFVMFRILMKIGDFFLEILKNRLNFSQDQPVGTLITFSRSYVIMQIFFPFKMRMSTLTCCKMH